MKEISKLINRDIRVVKNVATLFLVLSKSQNSGKFE